MRKLDKTILEKRYAEEDYNTHCETLMNDVGDSEQRYLAWSSLYMEDLFYIFVDELRDGNEMAMTISYVDWCRQMFIRWDCNRRLDAQKKDEELKWSELINEEINSLLN